MGDVRSSLSSLMQPRSIAVIGASDNPSRIGGRPIRYLLEAGFEGGLYPVNPSYSKVQGLTAFAAVGDLPESPDLVVIALPAVAAVSALRESALMGARGAIIFSADFAESGDEGRLRQAEVAEIVGQYGIALLGPNCLGAFNANHKFYGSFSAIFEDGFAPSGDVGIVSQSGGYGSHLCKVALQRGVKIGQWMTTGNEAGLDVGDCIRWMAEQSDIATIIAYAEGVRSRQSIVAGLEAASRAGKPVLFLKAGSSSVGADAARTHTAALSGNDAVFNGMLEQYGATRVANTEAAVDAAYLLQRTVRPRGRRVALVTISGAVGVQMADHAEALGLDLPALPEKSQTRLKEINPFAAVRNPIDITAQAFNKLELVSENLAVVLDSGSYDALVAFFTVAAGSRAIAPVLSEILSPLPREWPDTPMVLCIVADRDKIRRYEDAGFAVFEDHHRALAALNVAMKRRSGRADPSRGADVGDVTELLASHDGTEYSAKTLLRELGIAVPRGKLAFSPDEAVDAWREIGGSVAVKVHSPAILHKTEVGGVRLGLRTAGDVAAAAADMRDRLKEGAVLVEEMASAGVELIVGCQHDAELGPVVMIGMGGVTAELYKDVVFRLAPLSENGARHALERLKGKALFAGFRGQPRADMDAAASAIARLSAAFASHESLEAIEINPLRILPVGQGVIACDAVLRSRNSAR